ncbi:MAG: hypothetical protein N3A54_04860 [Patescibacteria group bacterium]|nr:hypothetical protein [Patescibacteria group bacterium]
MEYIKFKEILMEYTFKDLNVVFGKYFDDLFAKNKIWIKSFAQLYDEFESNLIAFKEKWNLSGDDIVKIPFPLIMNTYSKLKVVSSEKDLERILTLFLKHFPKLVFILSYIKKFPVRLEKMRGDRSIDPDIIKALEAFESKSFWDILRKVAFYSPNASDKQYDNIVLNYILPTYIKNRVFPIYEDSEVVIYKPNNWVESRELGADTEWCVSSSNAKRMFDEYTKKREFDMYFIFVKGKEREGKYAFLLKKFADLNKIFATDEQASNKVVLDDVFKIAKSAFLIDSLYDSYNDYISFFRPICNAVATNKNIYPTKLMGLFDYLSYSYSKAYERLKDPIMFLDDIFFSLTNSDPFYPQIYLSFRFMNKNKEIDWGSRMKTFDAMNILYGKSLNLILEFCNTPKLYRKLLSGNLDTIFLNHIKDNLSWYYYYLHYNTHLPELHEKIDNPNFEIRNYLDVKILPTTVLEHLLKLKNYSPDDRAYQFAVILQKKEEEERKFSDKVDNIIENTLNRMVNVNILDKIKYSSFDELKECYEKASYSSVAKSLFFLFSKSKEDFVIIAPSKIEIVEDILKNSNSPAEFVANMIYRFAKNDFFEIMKHIGHAVSNQPYTQKFLDAINEARKGPFISIRLFKEMYDLLEKEIKKFQKN